MSDIIERLRNRALAAAIIKDKPDLYNDAADAIISLCERLAEADEANRRVSDENKNLREALKPFAYYALQIPDDISDTCSASGTVGDLRAAAAALKEIEDEA